MTLPTLVLALAFASPQEVDIPKRLVPGERVVAEITASASEVHTPNLDANYSAAPTVGMEYVVLSEKSGPFHFDLRSHVFDAYLVLRDAAGELVAEDDDGLVSVHSRLVVDLVEGKEYRLTACALHGVRGAYTLVLEPGVPVPVSPVEDARAELARLESELEPDIIAIAGASMRLADALRHGGEYEQARPYYERALAILERELGPDDPATASSLTGLGRLLEATAEYERALSVYERALEIYENKLGPDHASTAIGLSDVAGVLRAMGKFGQAKPLFAKALAIREARFGPSHTETAEGLVNLAVVLGNLGELEEALGLCERALVIFEELYGPDHLVTATTLHNIAVLLGDTGAYAKGLPFVERALAIRESRLGPNHPLTATSLNNMGTLLWGMGELGRAKQFYERALAVREERFGPDHLKTAVGLADLGQLLYFMGNMEDASWLLERALVIRESWFGRGHPVTANVLLGLGRVLMESGDYEEALLLYERSLEITESNYGPDHQETGMALHSIGLLHSLAGDYVRARPLLERALAISEAGVGSHHKNTIATLEALAGMLDSMGEYAEARSLYERAQASLEDQFGDAHPDTAKNLTRLAGLLLDSREPEQAWALLQRGQGSVGEHLATVFASSTREESKRYLLTRRWEQELLLSVPRIYGTPEFESGAASALLSWKGQVGRAARTVRKLVGASDEAREVSASLLAGQAELSRLVYDDLLTPKARERRIEQVRKDIGALESELRGLVGVDELDTMDVAELRGHVPENAALVSFFVHSIYGSARYEKNEIVTRGRWSEPHLVAWVIRREADVASVDLGPARVVEERTKRFLSGMTGSSANALAETRGEPLVSNGEDDGIALREMLWDPLVEHLGGASLVIVSHDRFTATLPFEVLVGEDGRYLIEDRAFAYIHDLQTIAGFRDDAMPDYDTLFCVGGVDFDGRLGAAAPDAVAMRGESDAPTERWQAWGSLDATRSEVVTIRDLHGAYLQGGSRLLVTGAEATEERVLEEMPKASLVHLATHGYFRPEGLPSMWQSALEESERQRELGGVREAGGLLAIDRKLAGYLPEVLSGLVFAGANREREEGRLDGYLTAADVDWMDLSGVELATLSACETGLGRSESGEGMSGFRTTLLRAGVKTVISSLWQVPDDSTERLMGRFYGNLLRHKMGKLEALREAQLWMLNENRRKYDGDGRPHAWGPFVLSGDWR